jgi:hypothetical protein
LVIRCVFSGRRGGAFFTSGKGRLCEKIAVISAVLDEPHLCQQAFNETVSEFQGIIKGRMGIPFEEAPVAVISITVVGISTRSTVLPENSEESTA